MKRIATILLSLFFITALPAQESETVDVIYLHSGVVVRGTVISQDDTSLTVRNNSGRVLTYLLSDVESRTTEVVELDLDMLKEKEKKEKQEKKEKEAKEKRAKRKQEKEANRGLLYGKGFRGFVETGFGIGVNGTHSTYDLGIAGGYRFSKRFYLGAGLGLNMPITSNEIYYELDGEVRKGGVVAEVDNINVYVEPHLYLGKMTPKTKTIPYIGAKLGVNLGNIDRGGVLFAFTLNVQQQLKNRHSLIFSLGYNYYGGESHRASYGYKYWYSWNSYYTEYRSLYKELQTISIRIAYGF